MLINHNGTEFTFGCDNFLGREMTWDLDELPLGILVNGGTGTGKTNRVFLPFTRSLLELRANQNTESKWGAVILDPKLSFARRLVDLFRLAGIEDEVQLLSEKKSVTINPLLSGLSGQKIAEFLVKSLHAGKPISMGSGGAYYESRATSLLGNVITVALGAARPCLQLVAEMIDVLTVGGTLSSPNPEAADALRRIELFTRGEEKEKKMVLDSVQNYLDVFRVDPWKKIFFEYGAFNLDQVRDAGKIVIAAFSPNRVNNLSSGLFLLKMLWYSVVMERLSEDFTGNRERLCLFLIDEFQSVASGSSDADFLAIRREARCAPVFAFQQLSQLEGVLPLEWKNVLGLLSTKIFLRQPDPDTDFFAEKLGGFIEETVDAVTKTPDSMNLFYAESSRTTTRQLRPRIPAEYFFGLPDGDAVIISDKRQIAWFPAYGMTAEQEKNWRKKKWPERPQLVHPRDFRSE